MLIKKEYTKYRWNDNRPYDSHPEKWYVTSYHLFGFIPLYISKYKL